MLRPTALKHGMDFRPRENLKTYCRFSVFYSDVLDKEDEYIALSRQLKLSKFGTFPPIEQ